MKVVFDTNVYISGHLFKGGIPSRLVDLARDKKFDLFYSPEILEELRRVLETKFDLTLHEREAILRWVDGTGALVYPKKGLSLVKGCQEDNRILECALSCQADFLVTGDKAHLLPLKHPFGFRIISPAEFYQGLNSLLSQRSKK
ncbi:MAG: putative toxin-antitoxin system toxin component, PIN family [Deltaproteobacteria bacterium]|nr:putative toxin-antitoxin system toxin component, PIN family [Deltaproteobacteria bacterium]